MNRGGSQRSLSKDSQQTSGQMSGGGHGSCRLTQASSSSAEDDEEEPLNDASSLPESPSSSSSVLRPISCSNSGRKARLMVCSQTLRGKINK